MEGHEYLTSIGLLHRDISENNIVLGRRPGDERGYLIDFDMAILQEPEEPTPVILLEHPPRSRRYVENNPNPELDNNRPVKGLRTVGSSVTSCHRGLNQHNREPFRTFPTTFFRVASTRNLMTWSRSSTYFYYSFSLMQGHSSIRSCVQPMNMVLFNLSVREDYVI